MIEIRGGILSRRWAPEIILKLKEGPHRFNWMLNDIEGISDRALTERLRQLEDLGLLRRRVFDERPLRIFYELTEAGARYIGPLEQIAALEGRAAVGQEAAVG